MQSTTNTMTPMRRTPKPTLRPIIRPCALPFLSSPLPLLDGSLFIVVAVDFGELVARSLPEAKRDEYVVLRKG